MSLSVRLAVAQRYSCRAFLERPVEAALLREVLALAARAPSGGNLQPWHIYVLHGDAMARFRARMEQRLLEQPQGEGAEYDVYPKNLFEPHRSRRYALGEAMYALLEIPREDKAGRLLRFAENFRFFGAPAALFCFVDRRMGKPQWSDLGMYLQTAMLLFEERGLATCAQEAWSAFAPTVTDFCGAPSELMLFCGLAIGHADPYAPVNRLRSERAELSEFATFL